MLRNARVSDSRSIIYNQRPTIICGPSGVGKDTLINGIRATYPGIFGKTVSHTTRSPRDGEVDGVHYHFVDRTRFERKDDFIEITDYTDNKYGTSFAAVEEVTNQGLICLMNLHYTAAQKVHNTRPKWCNFIFITVSGRYKTLQRRLEHRGMDDDGIQKRLKGAVEEFAFLDGNRDFFDHVLMNDGHVADSVNELAKVLGKLYPQFERQRLGEKDCGFVYGGIVFCVAKNGLIFASLFFVLFGLSRMVM